MEERAKEGSCRVLFFNYEYPPLGGGAANANAYLLKAYRENPGLQVDLITTSPDEKDHTENLSERISLYKIAIGKNEATLHYQSQLDLIKYSFKAYALAKKLLRENKYDVIHAFFSVPCGALAYVLGKKYKIPYLVSLRGSDVPGYSERFSLLYIALTPFIKQIWKSAFRVVANSDGLRRLALQSAPLQAIDIIPNGVDTEKFFPKSENVPSEEWIITAGATRLTERKGIHFIMEALPALVALKPNLIFEVMGEGEALPKLQALVQERGLKNHVRFLGRIDPSETYIYYQRASVFILPSANEGMSNALLEALASGLPVIVTDTGGSSELVEERKNGFIISRTSEAIVRTVTELIQNEEERKRMGREARKRAESQSWSRVASQYTDLYSQAGNAKS